MRLLVADPERRMSMDEIKAHTWFSHALPTGALHMNDWYMSHPSGIDEARARTCTLTVTPRVREVDNAAVSVGPAMPCSKPMITAARI